MKAIHPPGQSMFSPHDGYTERGHIRAIPGLYPALSFTYRPFTQEQRARLVLENSSLQKADKITLNYAKVIAAKIITWDLLDLDGNEVKPSWSVITRLKPAAYDRLVGIVMGADPSDIPDGATDQDKETSLADELVAAESGQPVGMAVAEQDRKN